MIMIILALRVTKIDGGNLASLCVSTCYAVDFQASYDVTLTSNSVTGGNIQVWPLIFVIHKTDFIIINVAVCYLAFGLSLYAY